MNAAASGTLAGRTILITGAGAGLGGATARQAGAAGAEVILLGRTVRNLEAVHDDIVAAGGPSPAILPLDLEGATPDDYTDIAARIQTQCGRLHGLVHNAAIPGPQTPLEHHPPLEWMRVLQVNLTAPVLLTQACLGLMRHDEDPAVVFVGDDRVAAYWGAYGIAKAGLDAVAAMLAEELEGRTPIAVELIKPGPMRTALRARMFPGEHPEEIPPVDAAAARILAALTPDG